MTLYVRQRLHDADGVAEAQPVGALGLGGRGVLEQEAELGAAASSALTET